MARRKMCGWLHCLSLVDAGTKYCPEHERQRGWKRKTGNTRSTKPGHRARRGRILARAGHRCQIRYINICTGVAAVCDHIVPLAEGGLDADENCQAACLKCHHIKTSFEGHKGKGDNVSEPARDPRPAPRAEASGPSAPPTPRAIWTA